MKQFIFALMLVPVVVFADPTLKFDASVKECMSPCASAITWEFSEDGSCIAGDTFGWQGAVPKSGTRNLSGMKSSAKLTLACTTVAKTIGLEPIEWTIGTTNVDGTKMTNLAGYDLFWGTDPDKLANSVLIDSPNSFSYEIKDLKDGTYYFQMDAFNADKVYSKKSNIISRVVRLNATQSASATINIKVKNEPPAPVLKGNTVSK